MTRRSRSGYPHARRSAAEEALANREQLLARLRQHAEQQRNIVASSSPESAPPSSFQSVNLVPLCLPDGSSANICAPYLQLVDVFGRAITSGRSQAVLSWPARNISLPAVYALAVLSSWRLGQPQTDPYARPSALRALYYPWSTHTRLPLRHVYVAKSALRQAHLVHYQNSTNKDTDPFADLALCLLRVGDLDGCVIGGDSHSEYLNPTLEELVPSGPCDGQPATHHTLLHRCRSKTQLKFLSGGCLASDPSSAPNYLFGLHGRSDIPSTLRRLSAPVQAILLDLSATGRGRFGHDWRPSTIRFLEAARAALPGIPVVAVTDDPWVHRELMWHQLKDHDRIKGKKPATNAAVFTPATAIIEKAPPTIDYTGCSAIEARGFAGSLDNTLDTISKLRNRANELHDAPAATVLTELAAILRRCSNLPGSVRHLGDYVAEQAGEVAAINIMQSYRVPRLIAEITTLEGPLAQSRREALIDLCSSAREAWNTQQAATPMQNLLKDVIRPYLRNSSKTVVLLRNAMICDYALAALSTDYDIGEYVRDRLGKKMLFFLDEVGLRETTALPPRERHQVNTLIHVSPTRNQLLANMTLPWLPERQLVLADGHTLAAVARDAQQLAKYETFGQFASRLSKLAGACQSAADMVYGHRVVLDPTDQPPPDIDFPAGRTIDLSGSGSSPNESLFTIETENRQTIVARPGTRLLLYDDSGPVPVFTSICARDVTAGDTLCVIDDDFIDMARARLDIAHAANEEIRTYHQLVTTLYQAIPADSEKRRRLLLVDRINQQRTSAKDREVDESNIAYWVDLSDEILAPLEEVTPRAPKDGPTFMRLTRALGIADVQAERFWKWAVIATRSNRLRAAHQLHDAYLGILIAPHAAEAENPKRIHDIRVLRAAAERYTSRVASCTRITRANL